MNMTKPHDISKRVLSCLMIFSLLLTVGITVTHADGHDGHDEMGSIVDVAAADGRFTTLLTAAQEADLATLLDQNGPFTVFAPTDDAFAALPDGALDGLLADKTALRQVLLYHIVQGAVGSDVVVTLDSATTALGKDVTITVDNGHVFLNDTVEVIITDVMADNGVIHVIDAVLIPPSDGGFVVGDSGNDSGSGSDSDGTTNSIVDIAVADGRFNTLITAAQVAGLDGMLSQNGPFTVFAPTDDAFAKLPAETLDALLANPTALRQVLLYHIAVGELMAADVVSALSVHTALGIEAPISTADGAQIDGANIIITDIMADNGIIHVIDSVIVPPNLDMGAEMPPAEMPSEPMPAEPMESTDSIVDIAIADGRFTTLLAAAEAADLAGMLDQNGPFTLFAPTDDAFAKLPEGTIPALLEDTGTLRQILLFHVVQGDVRAADVVTLSSAMTALGQEVSIEVIDGDVILNGNSKVIITDIVAENGVIHVIDTVLIP